MINSYIKNKFNNWKINHIYIYDTISTGHPHKTEDKVKQFDLQYRKNIELYKELICALGNGQRLNIEKFDHLCDFVLESIDESGNIMLLLEKVKDSDEYTHTHCLNVSFYAMLIAKWLKLSPAEIKKVVSAGLLHDIGKLYIPDSILNNSGKLTPSEFQIMKQHSLHGYTFLISMASFDIDINEAVLTHHEREDGSGYPSNLKSEKISIYSKIIAVADTYDAITSDRVYKKKSSPFTAFKIINNECFNSLDNKITSTFTNNIATFYTGSKVKLNSGKIGEIAFIPPNNIFKPIIQVGDNFYDLSKEKDLEIECLFS